MQQAPVLPADLATQVRLALAEDVGDGDITAELIDSASVVTAQIKSRESAVLCGKAWVDCTFQTLDPSLQIDWRVADGELIHNNQSLVSLRGSARAILTGERTALNFLQTLSATATVSRRYAELIAHTPARILDTRKTLPGLRTAQKYAVRVGGCDNHRMGLFDAFLIKENHIAACGGIGAAISRARALGTGKNIEIEVQDLDELQQALLAQPDIIMLDNFSLEDIAAAVALNQGRVKLEASGGIDDSTLVKIAESGVDYVSIGALTKHCRAIDFTLLVDTA
ncbi:MAG TPA: carboxylating nicotinate-nucleotide diphosphorylase [candidate division Zixibacteria bacterium]|nr:carboxylating nicotinate-nucleotide diphosphorylase [candidate division Zixibacteria bacterium]